jgi:uncharacterized protein YijF (DUF1287 family)
VARQTEMRPASAAVVVFALALVAPPVAAEGGPSFVERLLARAREEVTHGVSYDPSYVRIAYPGGDVDPSRGVCTDVIVRALRGAGIDLQARVHEDVLARPRAYARYVTHPDANIDHCRVGPLTVWLDAHARRRPLRSSAFGAGDLVVWSLHGAGGLDHIGIVSDRAGPRGLPLVIHNIGPSPTEDDVLDSWPIVGHWRLGASESGH